MQYKLDKDLVSSNMDSKAGRREWIYSVSLMSRCYTQNVLGFILRIVLPFPSLLTPDIHPKVEEGATDR